MKLNQLVPTVDLCLAMDGIRTLRRAFEELTPSALVYGQNKSYGQQDILERTNADKYLCAAPTLQELLHWWSKHQDGSKYPVLFSIKPNAKHPASDDEVDVKDPNAVARACIEVAQ